jgi:hemerythrin-like domain-containing protein
MFTSQRQLWADTPFKLIPTPFGTKDLSPGKAHGSQFIAQSMTHIHNCILRLLNAMYNQAPYVESPEDIRDFLQFVKHWHDELEHHHMTEEECFFLKVEEATGQKGIMEGNTEQHHMFGPGLEALGNYATTTGVHDYDGMKLREIIDSFGEILTTHLTEEIDTLLGLEKYDDKAVRRTWEETHKYVLKTCDSVRYPMSLSNRMGKLTLGNSMSSYR